MKTVDIYIPFKPIPQKRHRHTHAGRTYDPCGKQKVEFLKLCTQYTPAPEKPMLGAVRCTLRFTFKRPKSHTTSQGRLRRTAPCRHVYKPDTDNLAKFVLDALNGVYYKDDSQIYSLCVEKKYGTEDSVSIHLQTPREQCT